MSNNVVESTQADKKVQSASDEELKKMSQQFGESTDFWDDMKDEALDDLQFTRGDDADQWDTADYYKRKAAGKPNHTFNRTQPFVDSIVGEHQRSNYSINVAATTLHSAPFTSEQDAEYNQAQAYQAIIKSIEISSNAERARNYAFELAVNSSMGYYSVLPEYQEENSFHQTIGVNLIANNMNVLLDPRAMLLGPKHANYGFIFDTIDRELLATQVPKMSIPSARYVKGTAQEGWYLGDSVRIAKYFVVMKRKATLILLTDGRVYESKDLEKHAKSILTDGVGIVESRKTRIPQTYSTRIIGGQFEGPLKPFPSKYIPIVPVFGRMKVIDGEPQLRSAIRNTKESQEIYNLMESTLVEVIRKAPKTQWMIDWEAVPEAFRKQYQNADFDNLVALFYDGKKGNPPQRERPIEAHTGLIQAVQRSYENVKGTMGMFQDAFENDGADASGVALQERRGEGESVSFPYIKNFSHAMQYEGEILVDMIPRVFNYEQVLRLPFSDGSEDFLRVNKLQFNPEAGEYEFANELTHQRFQITVDVGPAQKTARQEASDVLRGILRDVAASEPRLVGPTLRRIAENSDFPGAQDFSDDIAKIIDPVFTEGENNKEELTPQMVQQMVGEAVNEALETAGVSLENFRAETDRIEAEADRVSAEAKRVAANADMVEAQGLR